eukprot:CAMPEP_0194296914 /NCGR_PEP_ID=MMETSP0169-20130528/57467_1 /TAXON_ID=218684 /ORGANISM="Corethron pennatum, Strain L29A3" /LENGTH=37 /DNA_ID= /DNA_START= /DNA_END= /DNA_ORIENTATION=
MASPSLGGRSSVGILVANRASGGDRKAREPEDRGGSI